MHRGPSSSVFTAAPDGGAGDGGELRDIRAVLTATAGGNMVKVHCLCLALRVFEEYFTKKENT